MRRLLLSSVLLAGILVRPQLLTTFLNKINY